MMGNIVEILDSLEEVSKTAYRSPALADFERTRIANCSGKNPFAFWTCNSAVKGYAAIASRKAADKIPGAFIKSDGCFGWSYGDYTHLGGHDVSCFIEGESFSAQSHFEYSHCTIPSTSLKYLGFRVTFPNVDENSSCVSEFGLGDWIIDYFNTGDKVSNPHLNLAHIKNNVVFPSVNFSLTLSDVVGISSNPRLVNRFENSLRREFCATGEEKILFDDFGFKRSLVPSVHVHPSSGQGRRVDVTLNASIKGPFPNLSDDFIERYFGVFKSFVFGK